MRSPPLALNLAQYFQITPQLCQWTGLWCNIRSQVFVW